MKDDNNSPRKKPKVGHPPKWETVDEIIVLINDYFEETPDSEITVTGLCIALGADKNTVNSYQKKEGFGPIIKAAKLYIENSYERSLRKNGRSGDIFALKNFGWTDAVQVDNTHKIVDHQIKAEIVNKLKK